MVQYRWQIYATTGELFTEVGSVIGEQLDVVGALQVEASRYSELTAEGYNTTDFIPIPNGTRVIRVVCPVTAGNPRYPYICYYTAASAGSCIAKQNYPSASRRYHDEQNNTDVTINAGAGVTDQRVMFACNAAYMNVPATAKYFRISIDGQQWINASIQCYSAYGTSNYGSRLSVAPIYKDDLGISYEIEGKNKFLRRMLSGNVTFVRDDYDKVMNYDWQLGIRLVLQKSVNYGAYTDYWEGEFKRTDCTITYDDKKLVVTPKTHDAYSAILDKYENEYNLIDLAPEIDRIIYQQRPVLQIYTYNSGEVQNVIGNLSFKAEVDDSSISEDELTGNILLFAQISAIKEIQVTNASISSIIHTYTGSTPFPQIRPTGTDVHSYTFASSDSADYFVFNVQQGTAAGSYNYTYVFYNAAGTEVWRATYTGAWNATPNLIDILVDDTFTLSNGSGNASFKCSKDAHLYGRYLTAFKYDGGDTPKVAYNDPFVDIDTNNYPYLHRPTEAEARVITSKIAIVSRYSKTPTKYGRVEESVETILNTAAGTTTQRYYYLPPTDNGYYTPFMESMWGALSYWLDAAIDAEQSLEANYRHAVLLNDAFPLWSCIDVLAKQIDPRLSFQRNTQYSQFLFSATPVVGGGTSNLYRNLCVTQITNVSRGEYTQAAQKGEASLKWFFDMLAKVFNCFWWVDDQYRIHIEHISYFENGGSYTQGSQSVGVDLTALAEPRNGLKWSFSLGECTFETDDVAARYEFEWAIGATDLFNGNAIEVLSNSLDRSKKEEVSVSHFVADIDYVIAAPSDFSNDAWLLIACSPAQSGRVARQTQFANVPFGRYRMSDDSQYTFCAQNGVLAFAWLQPRFWIYGMSGSLISCNGLNISAASLDRMITQKVTVPYEDSEIDTAQLVRTSVGDGQIKRAIFNLSSRTAQLTLKYPMQ